MGWGTFSYFCLLVEQVTAFFPGTGDAAEEAVVGGVQGFVVVLRAVVDFPDGLLGLRAQADGHFHGGWGLFPSGECVVEGGGRC